MDYKDIKRIQKVQNSYYKAESWYKKDSKNVT